MIFGPKVQKIAVLVSTPQAEDAWITGSGYPGVHVVEGLLAKMCPDGKHGHLQLRVDPGAHAVVTPSRPLWKMTTATSEQLAEIQTASKAGLASARASARMASEREGWIEMPSSGACIIGATE